MKQSIGFIVIALLLCHAFTAFAQCDFSDNFSDGNYNGWTPKKASRWEVQTYYDGNRQLNITTSGYNADYGLGEYILLDETEIWNFVLECEMASQEWIANERAELAVVWGFHNAENYYYAELSREMGTTKLVKLKNAEKTVLDTYEGATLVDQERHHVKVVRCDYKVFVYFDGIMILATEDRDFAKGQIGVGSVNDLGYFDDFCINFPYGGQNLDLQSPSDHETIYANQNYTITWSSLNNTQEVELYYSLDAGENWTVIDRSANNSGSYLWQVPNVETTTAKIRIIDKDHFPIDENVDCFRIEKAPVGSITVINPNGGEVGLAGYVCDIRWSSSNNSGTVKLEYSTDGGNNYTVIANNVNDDGSYLWTYPQVQSQYCLVRISDSDGDPVDTSDSFFTINLQDEMTVVTPNGGETFTVGQPVDIRWTSANTSGNVEIAVSTNSGTSWTQLIAQTPDDGYYYWNAPQQISDQCRIRVRDIDGSPSDISDSDFSVVAQPSITVIAPNGGERLLGGVIYTIQWSSSGTSGNVEIAYTMDEGQNWDTIVNNTPDDGEYEWIPPNINATCLKVKISDLDGSPSDISDQCASLHQYQGDPKSPLAPVCDLPSAPTNQSFEIKVNIGSADLPLEDLFGISYTLEYDQTKVEVVGAGTTEGDFLGSNIIFFSNNDAANGEISVGASRKSGSGGVDGFGTISISEFQLVDPNATGDLIFSIKDFSVLNSSGDAIKVDPQILTLPISSGLTVWPGDANNDGSCNQFDVLFIGLYFNQTGTARIGAPQYGWSPYICPTAWQPEAATFADCNGDGSVNQADIMPIGFNFGKTHTANSKNENTTPLAKISGDTAKIFISIPDTVVAEGQKCIQVEVENIIDLFGISFVVQTTKNAEIIEIGQVDDGDFLGDNIISLPTVNHDLKRISYGATKKQGDTGSSGNGILCRIYYQLLREVTDQDTIGFELQDVQALDSNGQTTEVNPENLYEPLPVELASFTALQQDQNILLQWHVVSEHNNYGFAIERRVNRSSWEQISFIPGRGTTTTRKTFEFIDNNTNPGNYEYRLKQIDLNGAFTYSETVRVEICAPSEYSLTQNYPNPFNPTTRFAYSLPEAADVSLVIYNTLGQRVKIMQNGEQMAGSYTITWDATDDINLSVSPGIYLLQFKANGQFIKTIKMIYAK